MIHDLAQGSPDWHEFRANRRGASEAAAMLGLSPKVKRNELLYMKKTGTAKEFSDWVQANILDYGHEVEALARPLIEEIIGEDLYPVTCSDGILSASCDGLTMSEEIAFEHKQWNAALAESVAAGVLPEEFMPQCQQILMVTKAAKAVFVVSNGTPEQLVHMDVLPDPAWFERIRAGWKQFDEDLAGYQHIEVLPAAVAAPVKDLPALSIRVDGSLTLNHNLVLFGEKLTTFIADINTKPEDDQGFADAESAIKVMERAENALEAAEASALAQVSSVDDMVRTVTMYRELARKTRLMLEKMVKARKETIRIEIQQVGSEKADEHVASLNVRLGKPYMPFIASNFAGVMKGKKTVASLRDAVDTELARFKIEANAIADKIQINLGTLRELGSKHIFLFADTAQIVLKAADDLTALVKMRIAEHEKDEADKAEALRAKIAEEERVKAEAAAAETVRLAKVESDRVAEEAAAAESARAQADTKRQLDEQAANIAAARAAEKPAAVAPPEAKANSASTAMPPTAQVLNENKGAHRFGNLRPSVPAAIPAAPPSLRLGQIAERLGFSITADFMRELGFDAAGRDRAAVLYHESDFDRICHALVEHIAEVRAGHRITEAA